MQSYPDVSVFPIFRDGKLSFTEVSHRYVKASFFAANQTTSSLEVANRFSHLSKAFEDKNFISTFQSMYPNISELSIELSAGRPLLFAHVAGLPEKIPLSLASGGMSKLAAILLGMTEQRGGFVIIDEIENGFYHSKLGDIWRTLIDFSIEYDCQLFISTHSNECLKAAAMFAEEDPEMFTIIRTVLIDGETKVRQFSGDRFANAILSDVEIR